MERKTTSGIMLMLLLMGILPLASNFRPTEASPATISVPDDYPAIVTINGSTRVSILIDYGNGTTSWYEQLMLPDGSSVFNATLAVAAVDYTSYGELGVFVEAINNVWNSYPYSWTWWHWNLTDSTWYMGPVACDHYVLTHGDIIAWFFENIESWPPSPPTERPPRTLTVDDDGPADFHAIQEAINAANSGDTVYVKTGVYYESVHVNKSLELVGEETDTTIIDGAKSPSEYYAVGLDANNITLTGFTVRNGNSGIHLSHMYCLVKECSIRNNTCAILSEWGPSNNIEGNMIWNNTYGIAFSDSSHYNIVRLNTIWNNDMGIYIEHSINLSIYHNNFINNSVQVHIEKYGNNSSWDDGFPSGGNYWSDYTGVDLKTGPNQNQTGSDGIGDTIYFIDTNNIDMCPLMGPFNVFYAGTWNEVAYHVGVVSNSTVSDFYCNPAEGAFIRFSVSGPSGTVGFSRVAIPKRLLWTENSWTVLIGSAPTTPTVTEDGNYTYLYFTYSPGSKPVVNVIGTNVVPEFPPFIVLPLFMIATLLAVTVYRRRMDGADE